MGYTEFVDHYDKSGDCKRDEEDKEKEEDPDHVYGKEVRKKLSKLKCEICEDYVKDPFYICTKLNCLKTKNVYCHECYVDKWCKHNAKQIGVCPNDDHPVPTKDSGEQVVYPIQRYDHQSLHISQEARTRIQEILKIEIHQHYEVLYALKQYLQEPKSIEKKKRFEKIYDKFKQTDVYISLTDNKLKNKLQEFMSKDDKEKIRDSINLAEKLRTDIANLENEKSLTMDEESKESKVITQSQGQRTHKNHEVTKLEEKLKGIQQLARCNIEWFKFVDVTKLGTKEPEPKEPEHKESEPKEPEHKESEPKESEPKESESKESEPKELDPKESKTKEFDPKPFEDLFTILEASGKKLSFLHYSQYKFKNMHRIQDEYFTMKPLSRGLYDTDVYIKCANTYLFLHRNPGQSSFKIYKQDLASKNEYSPSEILYNNLDNEGISPIDMKNYEEEKDGGAPISSIAVKVIRTPISCRTLVIGGKTNKVIRELTLDSKDKPIIKPLKTHHTVEFAPEFDLFNRSDSILRVKTESPEKGDRPLKRLDELIDNIKNIDAGDLARKLMKKKQFRLAMEAAATKVKKEIKKETHKKWSDWLRTELLNASTYIMKYPEGVCEMAAESIFSDDQLKGVIDKIKTQEDKVIDKLNLIKKQEDSKDKEDTKEAQTEEEEIKINFNSEDLLGDFIQDTEEKLIREMIVNYLTT